jgi:hypothetical protein
VHICARIKREGETILPAVGVKSRGAAVAPSSVAQELPIPRPTVEVRLCHHVAARAAEVGRNAEARHGRVLLNGVLENVNVRPGRRTGVPAAGIDSRSAPNCG